MNQFESNFEEKKERSNWPLGLVGAIVGGMLGSVPWMIAFNFNWFIGWLGALIGFCAMKGYELLKGPKGVVKTVTIVVVSLVVVVVAQYATTIFMVYSEWQELGRRFAPTLLDTFEIVNDALINDSELQRYFLIDSGMGMFFALLGVSAIFKKDEGDGDDLLGGDDLDFLDDEREGAASNDNDPLANFNSLNDHDL